MTMFTGADAAMELDLADLVKRNGFTHASAFDVFAELPGFMVPAAGWTSGFPARMYCQTPEAVFGFKRNHAMSPATGYVLILETWAVWPSRRREGITKRFLKRLATTFPGAVVESVLTPEMRAALTSTGMWIPDPERPGDWFVIPELLIADRAKKGAK